jgi:hypothetical protein
MHAVGVSIEHHIGPFKGNRPAKLAKDLPQPRLDFSRGAIDQACRVLSDDMLERRSPTQRKSASTQHQA